MQQITRIMIVFLTVSVLIPLSAWGDVRQFIPRIFEYEGELEIDMERESNENISGDRGLKVTDTTSAERINLAANGYVYHPRFVVFLIKVSGGLKHEKFDSPSSDSSWTTTTATEYEFRTKILPEHPYNLELFTSRRTPLCGGGSQKT